MRLEAFLFTLGTIFFAIITPVYWFLSKDPTGTTALSLTVGLAGLIAFYVWFTGRRLGGPRPEDRTDGEIEEAAGEVGFFSPHSWWPLWTALGAAVTALGLAAAWWLFFLGVIVLLMAVSGLVFEYYHGASARQYR